MIPKTKSQFLLGGLFMMTEAIVFYNLWHHNVIGVIMGIGAGIYFRIVIPEDDKNL